MEGSGRWDWGGLEGLNILMRVPVNHTVYQGVFAIFKFDILGRLHLTARELNVERDIICTFVQLVPLWDLWS